MALNLGPNDRAERPAASPTAPIPPMCRNQFQVKAMVRVGRATASAAEALRLPQAVGVRREVNGEGLLLEAAACLHPPCLTLSIAVQLDADPQ